jgi:hypothetical protein
MAIQVEGNGCKQILALKFGGARWTVCIQLPLKYLSLPLIEGLLEDRVFALLSHCLILMSRPVQNLHVMDSIKHRFQIPLQVHVCWPVQMQATFNMFRKGSRMSTPHFSPWTFVFISQTFIFTDGNDTDLIENMPGK